MTRTRLLISNFNFNVKHHIQRIFRGYSDADCFNGDTYLAGQIANILTWIVNNGHGVAMSYAYGMNIENPNVDEMVRRRDEDYLYHAAIFREYNLNGPAINEEWKKEFGGVLDKDMQYSVEWLAKHFTELWD